MYSEIAGLLVAISFCPLMNPMWNPCLIPFPQIFHLGDVEQLTASTSSITVDSNPELFKQM